MIVTRRRAALIAAPFLLAGAAQAQSAPDAESDALLARMKATPLGAVATPEVYTPVETVRGKPGKRFRSGKGIEPKALAAAKAYADAQASFAFIVARNGAIVHERYAPGFSAASRYATASMHKAVLALAYGNAIDMGLIALSDPLSKHLPELESDPLGAVTVEQTLRMTGGVGSPPTAPDAPVTPATHLLYGTDGRAAIQRFAVLSPPGSEFAYNNASSQLAGLALQAAVGERYAAFLSRTLWARLGAGDAALWLDRPGGNPHLFCCLQATARDWLRVGELVRNEGKVDGRQVVSAGWVRAVTAPSPVNPNFGMNFWRGTPHLPLRRYARSVAMTVPAAEAFARDDVVFIDGAGGQRVYIVPSAGLTIVRVGRPSTDWDDSTLVNVILAGIEPR
jgi:CubicO group peptidase (beta-lactamase class C family)